MVHKGPGFYDDPVIHDEYMARRQRAESANTLLERPIFYEMLGDPRGLRVLDLGCGDAQFGRELLELGCQSYVGVDGSRKMVERATETLRGTSGEVLQGTIEEMELAPEQFDLVVSRLALHYIADLTPTFLQVHRCLSTGGRFLFSVEHPVITSCNASLEASARRGAWLVDDYFATGKRDVQWLDGVVEKHHRTVEDFFSLLQNNGFRVELLRESRPERERFATEEEFLRRARIPLFLFMAGRKM